MTEFYERRRALTKGQRTRERLLRAAIDRFGAYGYRATSVSQLSRDTGLTPAAAYAYFEDKETFWRAAVTADLDALRGEIIGRAARSERPIMEHMIALVEGLEVHPLAKRVMVEGSAEDLQLVLAHALFASLTRHIDDGLASRGAAGLLPFGADTSQLALGLETVMFAVVLTVARAGLDEAQERIDAVVALLQAAVGGPPTADERRR